MKCDSCTDDVGELFVDGMNIKEILLCADKNRPK